MWQEIFILIYLRQFLYMLCKNVQYLLKTQIDRDCIFKTIARKKTL